MLHLYGISNCDSVKKARQYLSAHNTPYSFHDFKTEGLRKEKIREWCTAVPFITLLNKKSTAWRSLPEELKRKAENLSGAISLMWEYNNLVKRPVAEISGIILIGFNEAIYSKYCTHG